MREHNFYLCKVDIGKIIVLDWYGGPHHVDTKDYFNHKYDVAEAATSAAAAAAVHEGGLQFPLAAATPMASGSRVRSARRRDRRIRIHVDEAANDVLIDL